MGIDKLGVEGWLVKELMTMYDNVRTAVKMPSPSLFMAVTEALTRKVKELLYANDLVLVAESMGEYMEPKGVED